MPFRIAAFVGFLTLSVAYALDVRTHAVSPVTCSAPWASAATETTLRIAFSDQVRAENIDIGEGEEAPGAVVYPDNPRQTVFVIWKDAARRRYPLSVDIRQKSQQVTYGGIGLGTTLKVLERLNGRPFELAGFEWDYSGTVTSWEGGRLESVGGATCELKVRLDPASSDRQEQKAALDATAGDRLFKSSDRNMQLLNPKVYEILLNYR
jgi:hypothetical protein